MRTIIRTLEVLQAISFFILIFLGILVLIYIAEEIGWGQPFWWLVCISFSSTVLLFIVRDIPEAYRKVFPEA